MKPATYCSLICAVIGFAVALGYVAMARMSPIVAYILCPPGIVATDDGRFQTKPGRRLVVFGPVNALIYGSVGFKLWLLIMGDTEDQVARRK